MNKLNIPKSLSRAGILLFALSLPVSHVPAQFGIGIAFLGWLFEGILHKRWQFVWHPFLGVLAFYVGWNLVSAAVSIRPAHSLAAVADNEWPALLMLMMFWTIDDAKFLSTVITAFFLTAGIAMLYALWQVFGGVEFYRNMTLDWIGGYYRAVGFYSFYLTFAAFALTVFFFAAAFALEVKKLRVMHLLLALLSFGAIIGSFARSVWLALAAGIPLFGFLKNRTLGIGITAFAIVLVTGAVLIEPTIRYRAESILDVSQNQTRLNLWKTSLNIFVAHPFLGVGEDNFDAVFDRYKVEGYYDTTVHPHNDYLSVLVASGLPGLLAFLGMWAIALREGLKGWKQASDPQLRAILLGGIFSLFGLLIAAFFQNYYGSFINCLGWWFVVGLVLTAKKLEQRNSLPQISL
jgi:O-antigen ligase